MSKCITISIEHKNYDITLSDSGAEAIELAIVELNALGENISAKQLLEAYIAKSIRVFELEDELTAVK
ncbi:hypothetical protein FACS189487_08490 [Campylobacterota bacterium]|nr:hypothetical protein FACS189487_08490 [Campylobacterota bacterium]